MSGLVIFVTTVSGERQVELSRDATIQDIIDQMPDKDVPPTNKRIYYQNKVQPEDELLADLGICNESRVEYKPYTTLKVTDSDIHEHVEKYGKGDDPKYDSGGERDISYWDTSDVTNMSDLFSMTLFDEPLNWDTSSVTNMRKMFYDSDYNQPLKWDTSKVEDMSYMFFFCRCFKQPLYWDTSSLRNKTGMFQKARYNQPNNLNL